jgi:hypothetical protein
MTLKSLAVAATLALAASGALADDQTIVLTQIAPGMFSGSFSTTESTSGLFVDSFTFDLPAGVGDLLGSGELTFASLTGPASLVVASLEGANGATFSTPPDADTIAVPSVLAFANAMSPLTLTVLGFAGDPFGDTTALSAGYSGRITFNAVAAVPEPETYGLMLAGLAAMGAVVRRRKAAGKATG